MNHLHSLDDYGMDYIEPQRVWSGPMWPEYDHLYAAVLTEIGAKVDTTGAVSAILQENRYEEAHRLFKHFVEQMKVASFIPGSFEGVPREMVYLERFEK